MSWYSRKRSKRIHHLQDIVHDLTEDIAMLNDINRNLKHSLQQSKEKEDVLKNDFICERRRLRIENKNLRIENKKIYYQAIIVTIVTEAVFVIYLLTTL